MKFLIENLEAFNRKERFYLLAQAIQGEPRFQLHERFRTTLGDALGLDIPADAFAAMDYHLEWIFASLHLADGRGGDPPCRDADSIVAGNQEDADLLVAFRRAATTHLVLVEAKGDTSWTNRQMDSKVDRLVKIFGAGEGAKWPGVVPHLVLLSLRESHGLNTDQWPAWTKVRRDGQERVAWMPLEMPTPLWKVSRCNDCGKVQQPAGEGSADPGASWWGPVRGHRKRVEPFPRQAG